MGKSLPFSLRARNIKSGLLQLFHWIITSKWKRNGQSHLMGMLSSRKIRRLVEDSRNLETWRRLNS
jgi:hypothetical protein